MNLYGIFLCVGIGKGVISSGDGGNMSPLLYKMVFLSLSFLQFQFD